MQLTSDNRRLIPELADMAADLFRGLGDPTRIKIVGHLIDGDKNVTELVRLLDISQGGVSNHPVFAGVGSWTPIGTVNMCTTEYPIPKLPNSWTWRPAF